MDLYIFILFILAVTLVAISVFIFKRRNIPGVKTFIVCILLVAVWNALDAVNLLLNSMNSKIIWFGIKMAFIVYIPAVWLMTILGLMYDARNFKNKINLLLIIPTITAIVVLTLRYNNWFSYNFYLEPVGKYKILMFSKGFWLWINASYNYLLNAVSIGILIKSVFSRQYARKKQAIIMIIGMFFPIVTDILFIGNINIYNNLDTTSISFCISVIVGVYGMIRYKFMDIVVIAREYVFEDMNELMIVLDENKKIVDMNRKALEMLNVNISRVIGMPINQIIGEIDKYNFYDLKESSLKIHLKNKILDKNADYYGSLSAIKKYKNYIVGYLILLYDITELVTAQNELKQVNNELIRLNERLYIDSIKDELTKVSNKKYITELLQNEIKNVIRNCTYLSIAMVDIDHFKKVNDNYGHLIGDKVLEKVAELINIELDVKGKVGRFGGEEFLILLPNTQLKVGYEICDKIRYKISKYKFECNKLSITISVGITELKYDDNINSLIKRADDCLYRAKHNGRNRVEASEIEI
ncbi:diguanylate cyclase [Clostridium sp. PL3]|uniref:Diguanylate cyclase n=1 Tax=Clostridium thailandense TaxID=2794346 RepID=A0A949WSY2_9CLOT|nr:diguanylate cyclase [Clostridium thailandense]MBV7275705.1 diguanylate cyclase [Clostridium thailandense]